MKIFGACVIGIVLCLVIYYFVDYILNGSFVDWFEQNYMITQEQYIPEIDSNGIVRQPVYSEIKKLLLLVFIGVVVLGIGITFAVSHFHAKSQTRKAVTKISEKMHDFMQSEKEAVEVFPKEYAEISTQMVEIKSTMQRHEQILKEEAARKNDLIAYLAHDLKTPLTSIISYVELLKHEDLKNERAKGFIAVLYEKSYRLKHLIEDLIEASKASSGNLAVAKMRVDYKQLTLQAMGELEDKTNAAGLTFKLSCDDPVFIDADGGHMWRILENLLSNVIKYAMRNSRIYVDIFKMDGYGVLVMKNISATPIDFDETRLTERFVRGDASRTTEGSGLGLSITQSLAEIQGGTFGIQVDGDLFKAIVSIPLWEEDEEEENEVDTL